MKTAKLIMAIVLMLSALGIQQIKAQNKPVPPTNLNVIAETQPDGNISVKLTWNYKADLNMRVGFGIFIAYGQQQDIKMFKQLEIFYPNTTGPDFTYNMKNIGMTDISVYVTTVFASSAGTVIMSDPSEIKYLNYKDTKFRIMSQPPTIAYVGTDYYYYVNVFSPDNCHFKIDLLKGPDGMQLIAEKNVLLWKPTGEGIFDVSLKATSDCDATLTATQTFTITVKKTNDQGYVRILSQPNPSAKVGETYMYQVKAESNLNCPILYKFYSDKPDQMKFDPQTGLMTWVPTAPGQYKFVVTAYLDCNDKLQQTQTFLVVVNGEDPSLCASIKGTINYDDNTPVPDGVINAWKIDKNTFNKIPLYPGPVQNGTFTIKMPQGNYALEVQGQSFYPKWYKDGEFITDADRIELKCGDQIKIDVIVKKLPAPKEYQVSGRVFDAAKGTPVLAVVQFYPVELMYNSKGTLPPDKRLFNAQTDADGNYTIKLPDTYTYIAHAVGAMNSIQYMDQYYNHVTAMTEADILALKADLTGINFDLEPIVKETYSLGGTVADINHAPIKSKVIATMVKSSTPINSTRFIMTTESDDNGYFKFNNLPKGEYVLMSIPIDKKYIPGYYSQGNPVVQEWSKSTRISVDKSVIDIVYEIIHAERIGFTGIAKVNGTILENTTGLVGLTKKTDKTQTLIPVNGAFVSIMDNNGQVIDFAFTDQNGFFDMSEVGQGDFTLLADKVGYSSISQVIKTDYSNESAKINLEFSMQKSADITGIEDLQSQSKLLVYPSPASESATLEFESDGSVSNVCIFNQEGKAISKFAINTIDGFNKYNLSTNAFATGFYFVEIRTSTEIKKAILSVVH